MKRSVLFFLIFILSGCQFSISTDTFVYDKSYSIDNIDLNNAYTFGNPHADIIVIEYASLECIYCVNLHDELNDVIQENIQDGKILYVFKLIDHPSFENDEYLNERIMINEYEDIQQIYSLYESYINKTQEELNILFKIDKDTRLSSIDFQKNLEELKSMDMVGTPVLMINDKVYYKNLPSSEEFTNIVDSYEK